MGRRNRNRQLELLAQRENLEALEEEAEEWGDGLLSARELGKFGWWAALYIGWFYAWYELGFGWAVALTAGYLTAQLLRKRVASLRSHAGSSQGAQPRRSEPLKAR